MPQPVNLNGVPIEQRSRSLVQSTEAVPTGTLLNVPSAPPTGPVPDAPIVAVNTVPFWKSVQTYALIFGLPVADAAFTYLLAVASGDTFDPATFKHVILTAALGAYFAWRNKKTNTVTK